MKELPMYLEYLEYERHYSRYTIDNYEKENFRIYFTVADTQ